MSTPATVFLELQGSVSSESPNPGYTRLDPAVGSLEHYVEFPSAAIAPGHGPFPAGSRVPIPVDPEVSLYFSDYGAPPALGAQPSPVIRPLPHPVIGRVVPTGEAAQFVASDGTLLAKQSTSGQVTGFSGKGKDGHERVLTVTISNKTAAGRVAKTTASWLFATMSFTDNGDTPLTFSIEYCPEDNLMKVALGRGTVQTWMQIDYSQSVVPGGVTAMTRSLTYYGASFMSQTLSFDAAQANAGMYLAAVQALWPFLERVTFFGPAIQTIVNQTAANLPKIPAPDTPAMIVGSIGFGTYTPDSLSQDSFVYSAVGTVGPALGPLAATAIDPGPDAGSVLSQAAAWMGWLILVVGEASLSATLAADYNAWVAWYKANEKTGSNKTPILIFYPKDAKGHAITYHANPWAKQPSTDNLQQNQQQGQNATGNQQNQQNQNQQTATTGG